MSETLLTDMGDSGGAELMTRSRLSPRHNLARQPTSRFEVVSELKGHKITHKDVTYRCKVFVLKPDFNLQKL